MTVSKFGRFLVSKEELCLTNVLQVGQSFRWIFDEKLNQYSSSLKVGNDEKYALVVLRQNSSNGEDFVEFGSVGGDCELGTLDSHLRNYFRLDVSVNDLYSTQWLPRDDRFKSHSPSGNRILAQEPWETLVSFICSSNNNISRITKMCHELCSKFGNKIGTLGDVDYYSFPSSDDIVERSSEEELRKLGFGYRAKYIIDTAKMMVEDKTANGYTSDTQYLMELGSKLTYEQLREHLMRYSGVGPKVADCVCLMGFKMDHVVPIDTHVSRIAKRDYNFQAAKNKIKDLSKKYTEYPITRKKINMELDLTRLMFVEKWGEYAGWAQGILFSNEVGNANGATSTGKIKKRELEVKPEVKEENTTVNSKTKRVKRQSY
ncbi:hypothetical protein Kpol_1001p14 [Vanderwaltozyma polyspora DSM 70294]|uniref:N-glycosylase/DNA lyase n=1 Tax=Vanderwaltozyma polyspora (strain ATCC 22028 / DSM 70294 / BCRC 21397 / CBS 2163 / NBRC 10782 / NRRL Y-8283 / UCD 57-17) TaxID=436907 RepID=A7TNQ1_VANPO|nr:uncharacterized protein Kpol_1001p14 [Vanderwaltozyma polyspora DSM 70294]EDO16102.1 hypothetical protein Kpol_1001p14 [Vanderwaltozyma polyspora DSM 70294]